MAKNTTPIFVLDGIGVPQFSAAANLGSDGSGSLVTLVTAGADGALVTSVTFRNAQLTQAASSAMLGKLFLSDAAGANPQIVGEVLIPAATRGAGTLGATATFTFAPSLLMQPGQILYFTQSVYAGAQDRLAAIAFGGQYA